MNIDEHIWKWFNPALLQSCNDDDGRMARYNRVKRWTRSQLNWSSSNCNINVSCFVEMSHLFQSCWAIHPLFWGLWHTCCICMITCCFQILLRLRSSSKEHTLSSFGSCRSFRSRDIQAYSYTLYVNKAYCCKATFLCAHGNHAWLNCCKIKLLVPIAILCREDNDKRYIR